MKNCQHTIGLLIAALFLVACEQKSSPISDDEIQTINTDETQSSTPSEFSFNSLDGTISVNLASTFLQQDAHSADRITLPEHTELDGLFYDSISNIGFYMVNHGKTNKNAEQYSQDLDSAIQKYNNFGNINIGLNDNQQINYQYTITDADDKLNESCVAIIKDNLYTVCAFSNHQDFAALNNTLKQISVNAD